MFHVIFTYMERIQTVKPRVAIARGETREEAVRNALSLVREDILSKVHGQVLVKPNFLSSVTYLASTQAGAVRPVLELLRESNAESVVIGEGGSRSTRQAFERFGYRDLEREFGIPLIDLNRDRYSREVEIFTDTGRKHTIGYSDRAAAADTVISVAVAKTHDAAAVTLSLKNMMGCLKRVKRPRMHGLRLGWMVETTGEALWNIIEDHSQVIKAVSGSMFRAVRFARNVRKRMTGGRMPGMISQCRAISENLAILGTVLMPDVAVIDAFEAMEGEGPGGGTPVHLRLAVAGVDPIACDAVMAHIMGFDPLSIGYLALAHERGLGVADLNGIETVGENPDCLIRPFKPHSNHSYQMRWREAWKN
ncbi:MAG: DUF362 domain-containing protein [Candidatus Latescibacterota bacterium]